MRAKATLLSCIVGALLLAVTFLCIIPAGLLCARIDHVSLKRVAEESEEAGKEAEAA